MPVPPGQPVLQLRIALRDVEPTVWRRVLVPATVRLNKLHRVDDLSDEEEAAFLDAISS